MSAKSQSSRGECQLSRSILSIRRLGAQLHLGIADKAKEPARLRRPSRCKLDLLRSNVGWTMGYIIDQNSNWSEQSISWYYNNLLHWVPEFWSTSDSWTNNPCQSKSWQPLPNETSTKIHWQSGKKGSVSWKRVCSWSIKSSINSPSPSDAEGIELSEAETDLR